MQESDTGNAVHQIGEKHDQFQKPIPRAGV